MEHAAVIGEVTPKKLHLTQKEQRRLKRFIKTYLRNHKQKPGRTIDTAIANAFNDSGFARPTVKVSQCCVTYTRNKFRIVRWTVGKKKKKAEKKPYFGVNVLESIKKLISIARDIELELETSTAYRSEDESLKRKLRALLK